MVYTGRLKLHAIKNNVPQFLSLLNKRSVQHIIVNGVAQCWWLFTEAFHPKKLKLNVNSQVLIWVSWCHRVQILTHVWGIWITAERKMRKNKCLGPACPLRFLRDMLAQTFSFFYSNLPKTGDKTITKEILEREKGWQIMQITILQNDIMFIIWFRVWVLPSDKVFMDYVLQSNEEGYCPCPTEWVNSHTVFQNEPFWGFYQNISGKLYSICLLLWIKPPGYVWKDKASVLLGRLFCLCPIYTIH